MKDDLHSASQPAKARKTWAWAGQRPPSACLHGFLSADLTVWSVTCNSFGKSVHQLHRAYYGRWVLTDSIRLQNALPRKVV